MTHGPATPSHWIVRWAHLIPPGGPILDLACGGGRHARWFLARGRRVVAVDRDLSAIADLAERADLEAIAADLEAGPWPIPGRTFAGVVVTDYLWRPAFDALVGAVAPGGALLYETFGEGNSEFGRPRNPDFLLRNGELLERVAPALTVVAYEHGVIRSPRPAIVQRIAAIRAARGELDAPG